MRLLEMSISAGVLIMLLAFLRKAGGRRLSGRMFSILWIVVLARLLLPGSLPFRRGIAVWAIRLLERGSIFRSSISQAAAGKTALAPIPEAASFGMAGHLWDSLRVSGWIWLIGAVCVGIYFLRSYSREYRLLAEALPLEGAQQTSGSRAVQAGRTACRLAGLRLQRKDVELLVHDRVCSPLVFGIVRQRIVMPRHMLALDQERLQHILTHEIVHIRRYDNLWKLLSAAAVCIHWFNPAVWLMYVLFARDLEIACDEQVLSAYGAKGRKEYAATLLTLAQIQKGTTLFCSGFLENPVKERIVAIMNYKKITGAGILCAALLVAGATTVFATNEQAEKTQDEEKTVHYLVTENNEEQTKKQGTDQEEEPAEDTGIWLKVLGEEEPEALDDRLQGAGEVEQRYYYEFGDSSASAGSNGYELKPGKSYRQNAQNGNIEPVEEEKAANAAVGEPKVRLVPNAADDRYAETKGRENARHEESSLQKSNAQMNTVNGAASCE